MAITIDIDFLLRNLCYDKNRGKLYWRINTAGIGTKPGKLADKRGIVEIDGMKYPLQNLIWFIENGKYPRKKIYFIDGNRKNTRISNLGM